MIDTGGAWVLPYNAALPSRLAAEAPGRLVLDLGETLLSTEAIARLSAQHRGWRAAGWVLSYAAGRSVTRGALVVALHQAGDTDTVVVASVAQAAAALSAGQRRLPDALDGLSVVGVSPSARPSTWQTRTLAVGFNWVSSLQRGYKTPFLETMLRTYGVDGMPQLGPALESVLAELDATEGELCAQVLASFASLGKGCPFCAYGHLYAADLLHFEATGELCPIDPAEMPEARAWVDDEVRAWATARLTGPVWGPIAPKVARLQALHCGAVVPSASDALLQRLLWTWTLISECSLQTPISSAPPLHPRMARARRLQRAYRAARVRARVA